MVDMMGTPGFDPSRPLRKVRIVRRDVSFENDLIPLPDAAWEKPQTYVKFLTPLIYMACGSYVVVAWDIVRDRPGILIINHCIFPQLRDWNRDFGQPIIETTFMIEFMMQKGFVHHRITSMGQSPELGEDRKATASLYIDALFADGWVDDNTGLPVEEADGPVPFGDRGPVEETDGPTPFGDREP